MSNPIIIYRLHTRNIKLNSTVILLKTYVGIEQ